MVFGAGVLWDSITPGRSLDSQAGANSFGPFENFSVVERGILNLHCARFADGCPRLPIVPLGTGNPAIERAGTDNVDDAKKQRKLNFAMGSSPLSSSCDCLPKMSRPSLKVDQGDCSGEQVITPTELPKPILDP